MTRLADPRMNVQALKLSCSTISALPLFASQQFISSSGSFHDSRFFSVVLSINLAEYRAKFPERPGRVPGM